MEDKDKLRTEPAQVTGADQRDIRHFERGENLDPSTWLHYQLPQMLLGLNNFKMNVVRGLRPQAFGNNLDRMEDIWGQMLTKRDSGSIKSMPAGSLFKIV